MAWPVTRRRRHGEVRRSLAIGLLLGCAWLTHARAQVWRTNEALWTAAVAVTPTTPRPLINLAATFARHGQWELSQWWLQQALTSRRMTPHEQEGAERLCRHLCIVADRCCASWSLPP